MPDRVGRRNQPGLLKMTSHSGISRPTLLLLIFIISAALLCLFPVRVYTDYAFVDECTGSRKGYQESFLGTQWGTWYKQSLVETFMRTNAPHAFQQRWTSYAGTGRDIFGRRVSFRHGRPAHILRLSPEAINQYCQRADDREKRRLYDVLSSNDQNAILHLSAQIDEALLRDISEPDSPPDPNRSSHSEKNQTSAAVAHDRSP